MPLTPAHRQLRAQIAANDPRFEQEIAAYFERQVDPHETLDPAERTRLAALARWVFISRVDQGLPPTVEDPATLDRAAAALRLMGSPRPEPPPPSLRTRRKPAAGSEG